VQKYDKKHICVLYNTIFLCQNTQFIMNVNNIEYNRNKVNHLVSQYVKLNKGETQDSVAAKIGVSRSTLYGVNPTAENLMKICIFFGIEPNELFIYPKKGNSEPTKHSNVVATPLTIYAPPEEKEELKKIMYEQQVEIAGLLKEKVEWMEKAHSLEIELERVKNANAPAKDALAG